VAESAADRDLGGELVRALNSLQYSPLSLAVSVQLIFFDFLIFLIATVLSQHEELQSI